MPGLVPGGCVMPGLVPGIYDVVRHESRGWPAPGRP